MKRMLEDELIDWTKEISSQVKLDDNGLTINANTRFAGPSISLIGSEIILFDGYICDNGDNAIIDGEGNINAKVLKADSLDENPDYCGAVFNPIDSTLFEKSSDIHASNLGTIARGFFKIATGKSVTAGTNIYQTHGQALHDAILAGDESAMPYTHLLCKVKGGSIFWLSMTADGSNNVMLSPNIDLAAGSDCYVIAAVQSSNIDAA
jgi:hypothetical protein